MPKSARPVQVYDFTAFSRRTPTQQPPGDRIDAQFREHADVIADLQLKLADLDRKLASPPTATPREATLPAPTLFYGAGGPYAGDDAGATATAADYAQVAIAWAENMPGVIPGNILAVNAVNGDHWSSRWWANQAAQLVSVLTQGGAGIFAEQLTVTSTNTLAPLSHPPVDVQTTMQIIVAGKVYSGCVSPPPFTVTGNVVNWLSANAVHVGDEVVARYRYAVVSSGSPTGGVHIVSLYYVAAGGQTSFPTTTADRFGASFTLDAGSKLGVNRGGARVMPQDGTGQGGYSISGSAVILAYPAGAGEIIAIDIWE